MLGVSFHSIPVERAVLWVPSKVTPSIKHALAHILNFKKAYTILTSCPLWQFAPTLTLSILFRRMVCADAVSLLELALSRVPLPQARAAQQN